VRKVQIERTNGLEDCIPEPILIIVDVDPKGWGIVILIIYYTTVEPVNLDPGKYGHPGQLCVAPNIISLLHVHR